MKILKTKLIRKIPPPLLNVSIPRSVLDSVQGDFLSALIIDYIHFRCFRGDRKPTWLKLDWIHDALPYISRSGLDKKLKKLVRDRHILVRRGEGKHYHKVFYSPSPDIWQAYSKEGTPLDAGKVYYNLKIAGQNIEASVVYAAIVNLLRVGEGGYATDSKFVDGRELGRVGDELQLDTAKLVEGLGLSVSKVRKAVAWPIEKKHIEARAVFGNKRTVKLPTAKIPKPGEVAAYLEGELPTECYPHLDQFEEEPTEANPHK